MRVQHLLIAALVVTVAVAQSAFAQSNFQQIKLVASLDRPQDGYCFDIPGVGQNLFTQSPIFAHNCKLALTTDSAVSFSGSGQILFPAVDQCVTVAGVNGMALDGASIILRPCGGASFERGRALQTFDLLDDGKLRMRGTDLCVTVGQRSGPTFSSADRWRSLFVAPCEGTDEAYNRWFMFTP